MPKKANREPVDIFKRVTDTFTAAATVILALTLVVTADGYRREERANRLQRTLAILARANGNYTDWEAQRDAMFAYFQDRWQDPMVGTLSKKRAEIYFKVSNQAATTGTDYAEWRIARRHLNDIGDLAFAYVHELADRETLAASECVTIVKSNRYFKELIKAFKALGPGQYWQVIPKAVAQMEKDYGPECKKLYLQGEELN